jgi:pimeloyl-ACP methyl ester carboxylesterase
MKGEKVYMCTEYKKTYKSTFVTGCLQNVGRNLVIELLKEEDIYIYCFINLADSYLEEDFFNKVSEALLCYGMTPNEVSESIGRIDIIHGDVKNPLLGISQQDVNILNHANIYKVWHTLDLNKYYNFNMEIVYKYNIYIANELTELIKLWGAKEINYISTAFLDMDKDNLYISAKKQVESILISLCEQEKLSLQIFRPSIVVDNLYEGQCIFGEFIDQINCFLEFVQDREAEYFKYQILKIYCNDNIKVNLISSNEMIKKAVEFSKMRSESIDIYYIFNPLSYSLEQLFFEEETIFHNLNIKFVDGMDELNPVDKMLFDKIEPYYKYFNLDISNRAQELNYCCDIEIDFNIYEISSFISKYNLDRIRKKMEIDDFSTRIIEQMEKHTIQCSNNSILEYFTIGKGPTIIIANAVGPNIHMLKWVIYRLSEKYRVISWETRGTKVEHYKNQSSDFLFGFNERAEDIDAIVKNENIDQCHVLAWCSGTKDALSFYRTNPQKVKSLILIAGDYTSKVDQKTSFINSIKEMSEFLGREPKLASLFIGVLSKVPQIKVKEPSIEELQNLTFQINPKFIKLVREGVLNKDGLILYCKRHKVDRSFECSDYINEVKVPTLIISGQYDSVCNLSQSKWAHNNITGSYFIELKAATHYIPLENWEEATEMVNAFLSLTF